MSEQEKNKIHYTLTDIEQYLQGKLSPAEMHAMEKAALQDSLLADAIEGYKDSDTTTAYEDLADIRKRLLEEEESAKVIPVITRQTGWWRIAAAVLVMAGIGITGWYIFNKGNNKTELAQQVTKSLPKKESVQSQTLAAVKPGTAQPKKTDLPANISLSKKDIAQQQTLAAAKPVIAPPQKQDELANLSLPKNITALKEEVVQTPAAISMKHDTVEFYSNRLTDKKTFFGDQALGASKNLSKSDTLLQGQALQGRVAGLEVSKESKITAAAASGTLTVSGAMANVGTLGSLNNTSLGGTLTTGNQPNITNIGSLRGLSVTGTITGGTFSGMLSPGTLNSITSLGNLSGLTITDNIASAEKKIRIRGNFGSDTRSPSDELLKKTPAHLFTGKVVDSNLNPIANANVQLGNTNKGVITDANGNFSFHSNDTSQIVAVNSLGYEQRKLQLSASKPGEIVLKESNARLNEVVVTGYGTRRKKEVTGSVSTLKDQADKISPENGWAALSDYLAKKINPENKREFTTVLHGNIEVRLTLRKGKVRNVIITKTFNSSFNKILMQALKDGPKWVGGNVTKKKYTATLSF